MPAPIPSILLIARRWFQKQFHLFDGILERPHCVQRHPQMGRDNTVADCLVANRHVPQGFQREGCHPAVVAVAADPVGINERCGHASNAGHRVGLTRNDLADDWRLTQAFIGHDGSSRFFNPESGDWDLTAPFGRGKGAA